MGRSNYDAEKLKALAAYDQNILFNSREGENDDIIVVVDKTYKEPEHRDKIVYVKSIGEFVYGTLEQYGINEYSGISSLDEYTITAVDIDNMAESYVLGCKNNNWVSYYNKGKKLYKSTDATVESELIFDASEL